MPDSRDNTDSVRVYAATKEEMEAEQKRLKKLIGKKPSLADVIDRCWKAYLAEVTGKQGSFAGASVAEPRGIPSTGTKVLDSFHQDIPVPLIDMLRNIVASGNMVFIDAINATFQAFSEAVHLHNTKEKHAPGNRVSDASSSGGSGDEVVAAKDREIARLNELLAKRQAEYRQTLEGLQKPVPRRGKAG